MTAGSGLSLSCQSLGFKKRVQKGANSPQEDPEKKKKLERKRDKKICFVFFVLIIILVFFQERKTKSAIRINSTDLLSSFLSVSELEICFPENPKNVSCSAGAPSALRSPWLPAPNHCFSASWIRAMRTGIPRADNNQGGPDMALFLRRKWSDFSVHDFQCGAPAREQQLNIWGVLKLGTLLRCRKAAKCTSQTRSQF